MLCIKSGRYLITIWVEQSISIDRKYRYIPENLIADIYYTSSFFFISSCCNSSLLILSHFKSPRFTNRTSSHSTTANDTKQQYLTFSRVAEIKLFRNIKIVNSLQELLTTRHRFFCVPLGNQLPTFCVFAFFVFLNTYKYIYYVVLYLVWTSVLSFALVTFPSTVTTRIISTSKLFTSLVSEIEKY